MVNDFFIFFILLAAVSIDRFARFCISPIELIYKNHEYSLQIFFRLIPYTVMMDLRGAPPPPQPNENHLA